MAKTMSETWTVQGTGPFVVVDGNRNFVAKTFSRPTADRIAATADLVASVKAALEDAEDALAAMPRNPASRGRDTEWARLSRRADGYRAALIKAGVR